MTDDRRPMTDTDTGTDTDWIEDFEQKITKIAKKRNQDWAKQNL